MTEQQANQKERGGKNKVWMGEEGIVYVKIVRMVGEQDISDLIEGIKAYAKGPFDKLKIAVDTEDLKITASIRSSQFRKVAAHKARNCAQDMPIGKVAIFGRSTVERTIASFVIAASRMENMKLFSTKEQALEWLKKW